MSPVLGRPCPGCKVVLITSPAKRCPACAQVYERRRGRTAARGYGAGYQAARLRVLRRDGYRCAYCGDPATTADHLIPVSRGGSSHDSNLVAACMMCNVRRAHRGS